MQKPITSNLRLVCCFVKCKLHFKLHFAVENEPRRRFCPIYFMHFGLFQSGVSNLSKHWKLFRLWTAHYSRKRGCFDWPHNWNSFAFCLFLCKVWPCNYGYSTKHGRSNRKVLFFLCFCLCCFLKKKKTLKKSTMFNHTNNKLCEHYDAWCDWKIVRRNKKLGYFFFFCFVCVLLSFTIIKK